MKVLKTIVHTRDIQCKRSWDFAHNIWRILEVSIDVYRMMMKMRELQVKY
jgi:hypothetical protein